MACEVNDILAQVKLLVNLTHGGLIGVYALHGLGVILIKVSNKNQKFSEPSLLKQPHQTCRSNERF